MAMLETLRNTWRLPGLRNRLLLTILLLAVVRIGAAVPVPGIDPEAAKALLGQAGFLQIVDLFSGGGFSRVAVFAMSVTPYINSSIIVQLLTVVIPRWEEMQKEGEEGRKKLQQYTRYGTAVLALVQAFAVANSLRLGGAYIYGGWWSVVVTMIALTAGTAMLMWVGEVITEKGIGNGISLIIFANIVARLPQVFQTLFQMWQADTISIFSLALVVVVAIVLVALVVLITEGVRKIPVEYAKRVVGKRVYGGQRTHLPMKINQAGVIPVIFAQSLLYLPQTIATFMNKSSSFAIFVDTYLSSNSWWFWVLNALFIIFFTYFYTAITFNPTEIADNMKKNGGFIPGYRPGKPTADYLARISERLTLVGSLFLAILTVLPILIVQLTGISAAYLGGTSLLIVVGVALETMRQIEAQLVMRHYQGFMRR